MNIDQLANNYHHKLKTGKPTTPILKKVITKARPYVKKIIHKLDTPEGIEYSQQDLEQTANLYVVKALRNYDSSLDSKFSTYMYLRVRGGIIQYMRKHDTLTRLQRNKAGEVRHAVHVLSQELGREPSSKEIAEHLGYDDKAVRRYLRQDNSRDSEEGFDDVTLESEQNVEDMLKQSQMKEALRKKLKKLDVRSRVILILVYYHDLTTKQIGKIVDIHNQYVSTLKQRALKKLRE